MPVERTGTSPWPGPPCPGPFFPAGTRKKPGSNPGLHAHHIPVFAHTRTADTNRPGTIAPGPPTRAAIGYRPRPAPLTNAWDETGESLLHLQDPVRTVVSPYKAFD